jgi:hypothetical protein
MLHQNLAADYYQTSTTKHLEAERPYQTPKWEKSGFDGDVLYKGYSQ